MHKFSAKYEGAAAQANPCDMSDGTDKVTDSEQVGAPGEEIDRSPPIGMFLSGESFFKAGQHLHRALEAGELRLRFPMPVYYLYCHALELTLKAFLRAEGFSAERLKSQKFGHKLQVLRDTCVEKGLHSDPVTDGFIRQAMALLHPFAVDFEFRYLQVGFRTWPTLAAVESAVADLMAAVKPRCLATLSSPVPDRD